jgi:hypothetical protein
MLSLTWKEIWARRLARHALLERASAARLVAVAGAVCGIHAQVMPAAELSLGIRLAGVTRQDVRAALWETRSLVKTYGLRGTIHLFPAAEWSLWMAALRADEAGAARHLARMGIEPAQTDALVTAIAAALDGHRLTLKQLGPEVVRRVGAWAEEDTGAWAGAYPRWRMAVGAAALRGQLCFGPNQGQEVTFVRPEQWLETPPAWDTAAALAEVLRRYLRAYGPATPRDFAQWLNFPPGLTGDVFTAIRDELEEVEVEGYRAFLLAADAVAPWAPAQGSVRLLPHFDCYLIGCHPRSRLFPAAGAGRTLKGGAAGPIPVLLIDGVVAGVWERPAQRGRIAVRVEPFVPLDTQQRALLEAEVARIGEILETQATLALGPVEVRPHL